MGSRTPQWTPPTQRDTYAKTSLLKGVGNEVTYLIRQEGTDWQQVPSKRVNALMAIPKQFYQSISPSGAKDYDSAWRRGTQTGIRPGIHLHWIRWHGKRGTTSYKSAVSTDTEQLRLSGPSSSSSHSGQGREEVLGSSSLWQTWTCLEGGGPINTTVIGSAMQTSSNSNQAAISISVIHIRVQPTDTPTAQSRSEEFSLTPLSSMA
jgi:hypothetical protein